jgi:ribosomal protein S18 acetylase RimI-like enzyme
MSSDVDRPALGDASSVARCASNDAHGVPANDGSHDVACSLATPNELDEVRRLIEAGLARRWGSFDPSRNRDLTEFATTYGARPIVVAKTADGRIVGCGILIDEAPGVGAPGVGAPGVDAPSVARIVRMSVAGDRERRGVGGRVLTQLIEHARRLRYREIVLETTETWLSAVAFYKRYGFIETHRADGDAHFRYRL